MDFLGEGHKARRCRRVTYPESYITECTLAYEDEDGQQAVKGLWGPWSDDETRRTGGIRSAHTQVRVLSTLETFQGQIDSFFCQLPCKCYLQEVASVGD